MARLPGGKTAARTAAISRLKRWRESTNMLLDERMDLDGRTEFLGVGPRIDDPARQLFRPTVQNLVQGNFKIGTFLAANHESRVYDDARKPRGKK
ncbi:MAG TPA: hypothetical protein VJY15_17675 [Candidatus Acidoferrum sp.]|nr:hypothetical protein [Candidatus Acidoferrum sp.]